MESKENIIINGIVASAAIGLMLSLEFIGLRELVQKSPLVAGMVFLALIIFSGKIARSITKR